MIPGAEMRRLFQRTLSRPGPDMPENQAKTALPTLLVAFDQDPPVGGRLDLDFSQQLQPITV